MLDLWYSESHAKDAKFSIRVKRHLWSEKTDFQKIDFFESDTFGVFFTLDGLMMVTQKDEFAYHDMIVHPAFAVRPDIAHVLVIGGGDGGTAREAARYPHVRRIDMVEIDRRVVELCRKFLPQTASCLDKDERIRLYFGDGLEFVKNAAPGSYDLILVDSTDPIGPGEGLFTQDFYDNCRRALKKNGIFVNQHESPYYAEYARQMRRAHARITKTFRNTFVYQFHMPTYPSGHWLFGWASDGLHPLHDFQPEKWEAFGLHTKYYNTALHTAAFALPTYVREMLNG